MPNRALLVAALLTIPATVHAADRADPATEGTTPPAAAAAPRWYGWQPLIVDASSIAMMVGGGFVGGSGTMPLEFLGGTGYLLGAPIIHDAHGQFGRAGTSLALRVLLPAASTIVGVLVAWAAFPNGTHSGGGDSYSSVDKSVYQAAGGFIGFGLGALTAVFVDDLSLAKERVPTPLLPDSRPTIGPRLGATRGGATFGVGGTF
jgi:hypothetical protein